MPRNSQSHRIIEVLLRPGKRPSCHILCDKIEAILKSSAEPSTITKLSGISSSWFGIVRTKSGSDNAIFHDPDSDVFNMPVKILIASNDSVVNLFDRLNSTVANDEHIMRFDPRVPQKIPRGNEVPLGRICLRGVYSSPPRSLLAVR